MRDRERKLIRSIISFIRHTREVNIEMMLKMDKHVWAGSMWFSKWSSGGDLWIYVEMTIRFQKETENNLTS
jgi:hypothetical protein